MTAFADPSLWSATLILAVPIAYAALAGIVSERAGIVNIALEGKMLVGAFFAVAVSGWTHNPWLGVAAAATAGMLLALPFAWAAVFKKTNHIIAGMALNIFAMGITGFLLETLYGPTGTPSDVPTLPIWKIPGFSELGFVGKILGEHQALVFLFFPMAAAVSWLLFKTPTGLRLRAAGEFPKAADAAGASVLRLKFTAAIMAGGIAGIAGADVSIGILNAFSPNMTAGRGYIALAAVIFSGWRPWRAFGASLLFGLSTAVSHHMQGSGAAHKALLLMLPYAAAIVALTGFIGRNDPPAALGETYDPGRR